ncbi:MAG TPA: SRPBCC family protein [Kribbella sp.]|nr:SRPBCC family protein [Kribbella sp.]
MADHEASAIVDVDPNLLFDYLSDVEHVPQYLPWLTDVHLAARRPAEAQGLEARLPHQAVHEEVEVTAGEGSEQAVHSDAWIDIVEENRRLRWGAPGEDDYHGELEIDFVADDTSRLTVRLHSTHSSDQEIDDQLHRALLAIKTTAEQLPEA